MSYWDMKTLDKYIKQEGKIQVLDLSSQSLKTVPADITSLRQLQVISLRTNQIKAFPFQLGSLPLLRLDLSWNKMISIQPISKSQSMPKWTQLQVLDLSFNNLSTLEGKVFHLFPSLRELHLNDNKLTYLPEDISQLRQLELLDLNYNNIRRLPVSLSSLTKLRKLSVLGNAEIEFPPTSVCYEGVGSILRYLSIQPEESTTTTRNIISSPTRTLSSPPRLIRRRQQIVSPSHNNNNNKNALNVSAREHNLPLIQNSFQPHTIRNETTTRNSNNSNETTTRNSNNSNISINSNRMNNSHLIEEMDRMDDIVGVRRILLERGSLDILPLFDDAFTRNHDDDNDNDDNDNDGNILNRSFPLSSTSINNSSYHSIRQQQQQSTTLPSQDEMDAHQGYFNFLRRFNERMETQQQERQQQQRNNTTTSSMNSFLTNYDKKNSPIKNNTNTSISVIIKTPVKVVEEDEDIPPAFLCPITYEVMRVPVVCADGHSYEKEAIQQWIAKKDRSPMTGEVLASKHLTPNYTLKSMIAAYMDKAKQKK